MAVVCGAGLVACCTVQCDQSSVLVNQVVMVLVVYTCGDVITALLWCNICTNSTNVMYHHQSVIAFLCNVQLSRSHTHQRKFVYPPTAVNMLLFCINCFSKNITI